MSLATRDHELLHWQLPDAKYWQGFGRLLRPDLTRLDVADGLIARVTGGWPDPHEPWPRMSRNVERY